IGQLMSIITNLRFPRFYVSTSKSIIKALINMHSFEIQLSPIG
ncbi:flavodoxin family protein, partial [Escherichia coli]|nr:flavodoxin family protein [Escherichia coli]